MSAPTEKSRQFVSYAQNFEDVILWRALKHVSPGSYVDIGAQDPVTDSVSMAFYEHGWRGVHVEPNRNYAERLRTARPDERVIEAAVGTTAGTITFFDIPDTGLSTGDTTLADEHQKRGFVVNRVDVPCLRLSDILDELGTSDIHWLKIDVEGMEQQVISSWQPSVVRPWIVVVESTEPNTTIPNFSSWKNLLTELGYEFLYFDGLNRFYVNVQHPELKESFGPGPNVFDDFTLSGLASAPFCRGLIHQVEVSRHEAELRVEQAEVRQHEAEVRAEQAEIRRHEAELRAEQAEVRQYEAKVRAEQAAREVTKLSAHMATLLSSSSWKLTRPLRLARYLQQGRFGVVLIRSGMAPERVERLKNIAGTGAPAKRVARTSLYIARRAILRVPGIGVIPGVMARHAPWLCDGFLSSDMPEKGHGISASAMCADPSDPSPLDLRARQIFTDIKNAIAGDHQ